MALFGFGGLLLIGGTAMAGGASPAPQPPQPPPPQPPPVPPKVDPQPNIDPKDPEPPPDPNPKPPPPPPPPGSLEFDLKNNWGGTPPQMRVELARIELAARIPGLARALAVKAWQAFRAGQPYLTTTEAYTVAVASPEYCRLCFNAADGPTSKALLDLNINGPNKWPKPLDYAGWASGSFGLFDILGGTAVYAGIHTDAPAASLPLMQMPSAKEAMKRYDVQGFAASYIVRRILLSTKYKVLKPGVNAAPEAQDSYQTWGNIFSAYAGPDNYAKGNAESVDAKTRYLARAKEIGIDLAKVAYPWPPGTTYKAPTWTAGQVWARLQDFKGRQVHDVGGAGLDADEDEDAPGAPPEPLMDLAQGLKARIVVQGGEADPELLLVVLHGRNADEGQLQPYIPPDLPARIAYVRANLPGTALWRWYEATSTALPNILGPAVRSAADRVVSAIAVLEGTFSPTRIFVLGYSQGASVAYDLVARGLVAGGVVVAGYFPTTLFPKGKNDVKLWAVHGQADESVVVGVGEFAYAGLQNHVDAKGLAIVPGATHALTGLAPALQTAVKEMVKA